MPKPDMNAIDLEQIGFAEMFGDSPDPESETALLQSEKLNR